VKARNSQTEVLLDIIYQSLQVYGASGICHERAHFLRLPVFQTTLAQIKHIRWRPGSFLLPQRCSMWVCPHHLGIEFGQTHIEKLMKVFYWA